MNFVRKIVKYIKPPNPVVIQDKSLRNGREIKLLAIFLAPVMELNPRLFMWDIAGVSIDKPRLRARGKR